MKNFIQIIIQQKSKGDYRSFCICEYNKERWELRGYGVTPAEAAADAMARYEQDYEKWEVYGYTINDHLRYPNIDIRDIADVMGIELTHMFGWKSEGRQIKLKLEDGRTLTLKNGDTPDHYSVTCE